MTDIWVEFELPQHILDAINSGDMMRRGGVIQRLHGQVVMWLKETGRWRDALEAVKTPVISPLLASQMHALQMSTNIITGLQVLNLGVMVAGFAILGTELDFCQREGIEMKEWEAIGAAGEPEDRYLAFVGPQG